jgi:predicted nucleic acid-binding protein
MKVYLDNSFLNRPFDNLSIQSHKVEAEILFFALEQSKKGALKIVNSSFIEYENSRNSSKERKEFVENIMEQALYYQEAIPAILKRAESLQQEFRIGALDSLHIVAAETMNVDFFVTCDYTLIKRYKGTLKVVVPLEFMHQYENR